MASDLEKEIGKTEPVKSSVSRVDHEVAVGEDLEFQRRWWRFEKFAWAVFTLLIVLDLLGAFGRGPLAKARASASDGSMHVRYERIERTSTPAILHVDFPQASIRNGELRLFVSGSMQMELGTQRVIPAPLRSVVGHGGLEYTFPATEPPASVEFAMEPTGPGVRHVTLQTAGGTPLTLRIVVMP